MTHTTTFTPTGKQTRKQLAELIGTHLSIAPVYEGTPTFGYVVGEARIDRDWQVTWPADLTEDDIATMMAAARLSGFNAQHDGAHGADEGVTLVFPTTGWNERTRGNLDAMLASKTALITKALGIETILVEFDGDTARFAWFNTQPDPAVVHAAALLLEGMIDAAAQATRVSAKPPTGSNEKYAMRCFLLRLGFIGETFKSARRVLLANLEGSAAWATPPAKTVPPVNVAA